MDRGKLTSCHMFPGCKVKVALLLLITLRCHSESQNGTNRETEGEYNLTVVFVHMLPEHFFFSPEQSTMAAVALIIALFH